MSFMTGLARPWRIALYLLFAVFSLLIVVLAAVSLLLNTSAGSKWLLSFASDQVNNIPDMHVQFANSEGALLRGMTLNGLETEFAGTAVSADELVLAWNPFSVLSGNLIVSELRTSGLRVTLPPATAATDSEVEPASPGSSLISFSPLPVGIEISELSLENSTINVADQIFVVDQLSLSASLVGVDLQLRDLHIDALSAIVDGGIDLQLRDFLPLEGTINWTYAEAITEQITSLAGELSLTGDLLNLNVSHQLSAPFTLRSEGVYQSGLDSESAIKNAIDFTHTANALALPLAPPIDISLRNLALKTTGDITRVLVSLDTLVQGPQIPSVAVLADGVYAGSSFTLDDYQFTTDTGALRGAAWLDWSESVTVQLDYTLTDTDPLSYLSAEMPVMLNDLDSAGSISIRLPESGLEANLVLEHINANLSNYPVTGRGQVNYLGDTVQVEVLELSTAQNQISLSGEYAETIDLQLEIDAPRLDQILPDASGGIVASASVRGSLDEPDIDADFTVSELSYGPYSVQDISLVIDSASGNYQADLRLLNGQFATDSGAEQLQEFSIDFDGSLDSHQIVTKALSDYANIDLALQGGVADLENPQWLGSLTRAHIDSVVGKWRSTNPSELAVSQQTISLAEHCWSHRTAELCLDLNSDLAQALTANVSLRDYPLSVVNYPNDATIEPVIKLPGFQTLPENVVVEGVAAADLALTLPYGGEMDLTARLYSQGGSVIVKTVDDLDADNAALAGAVDDEQELLPEHKIDWQLIDLQATMQAGAWDINGEIELDGLSDESTDLGVDGVLDLALGVSADQQLSGSVIANFGNLAWVEAFVADISSTTGSLNTDLTIGGSITTPEVTGNINLLEAGTTIDALGISLSDLQVTVSSTDNNLVNLDAKVRSGEGDFSIKSQLANPYTENRELTAQLNGSNFQLADRPDLKLTLSPEITLKVSEKAIRFDGEVTVPLMNLLLIELPPSAVDVTRDVVVVSYPDNNPALAQSIAAEQATAFDIPITGEVDIILGDNVSFTGFGMDARVGGSLNLRQQANGSILTYGEVSVLNGGYELYGQRLTLERGKIIFLGAYDNPAVDIRATRRTEDVPGLAEDITAGVIMNGTIKNLSSQLFSTPVLPENDIIAIIVTGKPLSAASGEQDSTAILGAVARLGLDKGQGFTNQLRDGLGLDTLEVTNTRDINNSALTVGKYLTPKIFVRYGLGLFDNQSTVAVDYSVTNNVKLQAESGEYQSVDITYTIEQ